MSIETPLPITKLSKEFFSRGGFDGIVIIINGEPGVAGPIDQILGEHLPEDARVLPGSFRCEKAFPHSVASGRNDLCCRFCDSDCQGRDVR